LFLLEAAQKRCKRREDGADPGACAAREGEEIQFPAAVPDGYLGYHAPRPRGPDDGLASVFSAIDSLHEPPSYISELKKRESALRGKRTSLSKRVADLERELGDGGSDGSSKYGVDGELYALRDTCHKVTKGKYEYEVCIFGSATQREGGGGGGGTNLGSWKADGRRLLKWEGGAKCWNGPARSAEVSVTCGAETRLLTADEPETCRYVFTMESPIGCDEEFRMKNSID
jgi:protein kinase C substrate 80K-H